LSVFVFNDDDEYYHLVDRRGREVKGAYWEEIPQILSGVFVIKNSEVYTVIGDIVKNLEADKVLNIINFWVYYIRDGKQYVSRLEPLGLKFKAKSEIEIEQIGFLSHNGCVVMQHGEWVIYQADFGVLTKDSSTPHVTITADSVINIIKKGFTTEYIKTLVDENDYETLSVIKRVNVNELWSIANKDFINMIKKLYELTDTYSTERIGDSMGLKPHVVSVLMQYLEIKDFTT